MFDYLKNLLGFKKKRKMYVAWRVKNPHIYPTEQRPIFYNVSDGFVTQNDACDAPVIWFGTNCIKGFDSTLFNLLEEQGFILTIQPVGDGFCVGITNKHSFCECITKDIFLGICVLLTHEYFYK